MCAQDIDCANKFKCIYGKCSCSGQYETYDSNNRDCDLIKLPNEKHECIYNKDCNSDRLACDRTINGNKTFTCGRVYGEFCQVYEDCANGLQCGAPSYTCECQVRLLFWDSFFKNNDVRRSLIQNQLRKCISFANLSSVNDGLFPNIR